MTGDGRADVVASYGGNSPNGAARGLRADAGRHAGAPPVTYQSYDIPGAVEVADVDRDGAADAVVVHEGWPRSACTAVWPAGSSAGEDLYPVPFSNGGNPHGLAVGDMTGDGWPDIVVADDLNGLLILPNIGEAAPPPTPRRPRAAELHAPPPTPTPVRRRRPPRPRRRRPPRRPRRPRRPCRRRHPNRSRRRPNLASGVGLTWQPPAVQGTFPVTGYRIYRGTSGATPTPLVTVGQRARLHRCVGRERDDIPVSGLGDQRGRRGGRCQPRSPRRAGPPRPLPGA